VSSKKWMVINKMKSQPFYHLRPNKFIDRHLFVQMLSGLRTIYPINEYQYVGFGSFLFDDFKLLHNQLGISDMVSLESNVDISKRADFNKPYKCISIQNSTSTDYISDTLFEKPIIFWLDYTDPAQLGNQFSDFCTLIGKMNVGDIIRVTLNANPSSLFSHDTQMNEDMIYENRLVKLKERISEYIPSNITNSFMSNDGYPLLLLSCLENAAYKTLSPSQDRQVMLLFASRYADGQQMVTITAIVVDSEEAAKTDIKKCLKSLDYVNFDWKRPCCIHVPVLTAKEIFHINSILPTDDPIKTIEDNFSFAFSNNNKPRPAIQSYVNYYKHYPNFHHVSL